MRFLIFASLLPVLACAPVSGSRGDVETLLSMHEQVLRSHLEGDLPGWMELEAEDYVSANRGEITFPDKASRRERRSGYLSAVRFEVYRDLRDPIVKVSGDGTLGWVIVEVELKGTHTADDGTETPIEGIFAWIELYEKVDGRWLCVGNVSNARPTS